MEREKLTIDIPTNRIERQAWIEMPLPDARAMAKFVGWALGRVIFGFGLFTVSSTKLVLKILTYCCECLENGGKKLLNVYDAMPLMGVPLQSVTAELQKPQLQQAQNIETVDLLEAIQGKHVFIIGDTGTGKSTLAQFIAYRLAGDVTVYDADAAPDEWQGLKVIGRKGNFQAIQEAMAGDLEELQRRIELRGESGDKALAGMDSAMIAEEFPLLASEVEIASEWLIKHGRRGRKPKRLVVAISQDDSVKTLGIEGEGQARKNFKYIRLGKFALDHAKKLGNPEIEAWLKAGKHRCMIEDSPCQLPDTKIYNPVTTQLPQPIAAATQVMAEVVTAQGFQPIVTDFEGIPDITIRAVKACLGAGLSDTKIIKEVLGFQGSQFLKGKDILQKIRQ